MNVLMLSAYTYLLFLTVSLNLVQISCAVQIYGTSPNLLPVKICHALSPVQICQACPNLSCPLKCLTLVQISHTCPNLSCSILCPNLSLLFVYTSHSRLPTSTCGMWSCTSCQSSTALGLSQSALTTRNQSPICTLETSNTNRFCPSKQIVLVKKDVLQSQSFWWSRTRLVVAAHFGAIQKLSNVISWVFVIGCV